jgi:UDP-glucose 4-epimerase
VEADEVEVVVGLARRMPAWSPPKVSWRTADVARDPLVEHFRGADVVVHLAWAIQPSHRPRDLWATNVVGSRRVIEAVAEAGVPALVHASSVGTYSSGPKDRPVDESWPTDGIPTHDYSWQKAYVERLLDGFEARHPDRRVVRLRPGLVFGSSAAVGIHRLFLAPGVPRRLLGPWAAAVAEQAPFPFQVVHSPDAGRAYLLAVTLPVRGAFNIAADPPLGRPSERADPAATALRWAAAAAWRSRLVAASAGWIDLAAAVPVMDVSRAHGELGWAPSLDAHQTLRDLLSGFRHSEHPSTPPLEGEPSPHR